MQSDSAPPADSDAIVLAVDRAGKEDDPVRRLLTEPSGPAGGLRLRHWVGVVVLALTVGGAAVILPPMISSKALTLVSPAPSSAGLWAGPPASQAPIPSGTAVAGSTPASAMTSTLAGGSAGPTRRTVGPKSAKATVIPTAKATQSPTKASPTAFKALSVQAEDAALSGGAEVVDCATCLGGQRVKYVGRVEAQFTVPASGERTITITYTVNDTREVSITVNDTVVVTARKVTGTSWEMPVTLSVKADIPAGPVTIAVFGALYGPDLDAISIS